MKLFIETTGNFQLVNPIEGSLIRASRPTVVADSSFVQQHLSTGALSVVGYLTDEATDDEWASWLKESDEMELAKASFLSRYNQFPDAVRAEEPVSPTPSKTARRK